VTILFVRASPLFITIAVAVPELNEEFNAFEPPPPMVNTVVLVALRYDPIMSIVPELDVVIGAANSVPYRFIGPPETVEAVREVPVLKKSPSYIFRVPVLEQEKYPIPVVARFAWQSSSCTNAAVFAVVKLIPVLLRQLR
jgi:hypothetical protein